MCSCHGCTNIIFPPPPTPLPPIRHHKHHPPADKGIDWRCDSSGNENNQHTDPEAPNSDSPVAAPPGHAANQHHHHHSGGGATNATGSPPRDKDARHKLFRVASSTPSASGSGSGAGAGSGPLGSSKQRQTLSLSGADALSGKSALLLDTCLSPTNVEPRKTLLDQLQRTFATEEAMLPDVLTIVGPPEPHSGYLTQRLAPLFAATFRPTFVPHNTAEVKAVMQALMNKIHK